jgi:hypothetical protein
MKTYKYKGFIIELSLSGWYYTIGGLKADTLDGVKELIDERGDDINRTLEYT